MLLQKFQSKVVVDPDLFMHSWSVSISSFVVVPVSFCSILQLWPLQRDHWAQTRQIQSRIVLDTCGRGLGRTGRRQQWLMVSRYIHSFTICFFHSHVSQRSELWLVEADLASLHWAARLWYETLGVTQTGSSSCAWLTQAKNRPAV